MGLLSIEKITTAWPQLQGITNHINRIADRSNAYLPLVGGPGVRVSSIEGAGSAVFVDGIPTSPIPMLAIIQGTGPNGEVNYTDPRYWVKFAYLSQGVGDNTTTKANPKISSDPDNVTFTATNTMELSASTHSMTVGSVIWVQQLSGRSPDGNTVMQWIVLGGAERPSGQVTVLVKANGNDGTNPKYDLYAQSDTGYVTKLNLAGALIPQCSRARFQTTVAVTVAVDGSVATAYYDTSEAIQLFDLQESIGGFVCT